MQTLAVPQGPRNPQGFTEAQILAALQATSGSRNLSFRYERLSSANVFLAHLDNVEAAKVEQNWLADIKRKASFDIVATGNIDFLSDRIKPYIRLNMSPYGEDDFVEWPQGVFLLSTPSRQSDQADTVYRNVEGYDQTQIYLDDKVIDRYSSGAQKEDFETMSAVGLRTTGLSGSSATTPDTANLDVTGDFTLIGRVWRTAWGTLAATEYICSKYHTTSAQRGWRVGMTTTGRLMLETSADGNTPLLTYTSSTLPPVDPATGDLFFKLEFDANNGASKSVATWYTGSSATVEGPWTQLGNPHNTNANTSIFANTAAFMAGGHSNATGNVWNGVIKELVFQTGIGLSATTVLDVDFTAQTVGTIAFNDTTSRAWGVNSAATIASTADPVQFIGTWFPTTSQAYRGTHSFTNLDIGNSGTSDTLINLATGTHTMSFAYKVSSEANADYFRVLLDGVLELEASGEVDWTATTIDVTGVSVVTFRYIKNASTSTGSDSAWIDDLSLVGGVKYTDEINTLLGSGVSKNITVSSKTLPTVKEWEPGTPKLEIINDLLSALNYESLSFDEDGVAIVQPYVSPADRAPEFTYQDNETSVMYPEVMQELDLFSIPNRWVLTVSDPDRDVLTSVFTNTDPASPTSTVRRGRIITDFRTEQDAADQLTLDSKVARLAFESSQIYEAIEFETGIMPIHSGNDVYNLIYDPLAINGQFSEHTWSLEFKAGAKMKHRARRVVTV